MDVPGLRGARWKHVQSVGRKAEYLCPMFGNDGPLLIAAAWLHDIGYAPEFRRTGFHHLDGARVMERSPGGSRLAALVANHSGGAWEAPLRGLSREMSAYPDEESPIRDALWTCDMTTGPTGKPVTFDTRLRDIVDRYGPEHSVARSILAAAGTIDEAITRTRGRARAWGLQPDF